MTAAAPVKPLLVWLTEHHSIQSDGPVGFLPCTRCSSTLEKLGQQHVSINFETGKSMDCLQACDQIRLSDGNGSAASVQQKDCVSCMIRDGEVKVYPSVRTSKVQHDDHVCTSNAPPCMCNCVELV